MFKALPALRGRLEAAEAQALPGGQTPKISQEGGAGRGPLIAQSPLASKVEKGASSELWFLSKAARVGDGGSKPFSCL